MDAVEIKVEKHQDSSGPWYGWEVLVDGERFADGEEGTRAEAMRKARLVKKEYEEHL